jgi:membrane protein DedA with SNARE-associated domain
VHYVESWLGTLPPETIYLIVGLVIGLESMGIPLPGEITLVSAALLASTGLTSPWGVAVAASIGAIVGDSIGYAIGRRGGRALLERLGRRFPKHMGPPHLARAERIFARWGVWAVFFGRFVALLRILAGPLAGALHVPYRKFLVANAAGGVVWAFSTTYLLYYVGRAAERWLKDLSWAALVIAVLGGVASTIWLKRRASHGPDEQDGTATDADVPGDRVPVGRAAGIEPASAPAITRGDHNTVA